ncbi:MAG TPA: septal ring lytic transglycosylase RlpA family protein [Croceibacterium sp.]|nr:septal ring lytic transglycosylase RlpA family protein [Croceibacterium sp.]
MGERRAIRVFGLILSILALAACGGGEHFRPVSDVPVRIGQPYTVRGTTYVPAANPAYDQVGYATWYGNESGNKTASGERFEAKWITAAHTTLPLPTYVEVTALNSGKRIIVRVNDRGPFAGHRRIIDLSRGAAEQLGIKSTAPVRVRVVQPSEKDRERLRQGKPTRPLGPVPERELSRLRQQLASGG